MTIQEYAKHINRIAETNPNLTVVHQLDDVGNMYEEVTAVPMVGEFNGEEFLASRSKRANAVRVN